MSQASGSSCCLRASKEGEGTEASRQAETKQCDLLSTANLEGSLGSPG